MARHAIELILFLWHTACQMMPPKVWPNTALGCKHQSICMPQLQPLCSAVFHGKAITKGSGNEVYFCDVPDYITE
jgi:hypothetical protein